MQIKPVRFVGKVSKINASKDKINATYYSIITHVKL